MAITITRLLHGRGAYKIKCIEEKGRVPWSCNRDAAATCKVRDRQEGVGNFRWRVMMRRTKA